MKLSVLSLKLSDPVKILELLQTLNYKRQTGTPGLGICNKALLSLWLEEADS
jgi:hypothetical protein